MTHTTENPTLELLTEKYNGARGQFNRLGVAVLDDDNHAWKLGKQGEVRWAESNNIVPTDILEMAVVDGKITIEMLERTTKQNSIETQKFLDRYQTMREKHGYSEEEQMEMRCEFGDEEVVDVFTGKVIS